MGQPASASVCERQTHLQSVSQTLRALEDRQAFKPRVEYKAHTSVLVISSVW